MPIVVLDPTTQSDTQTNQLATRLPSLVGRRVGVLDNRKANADRLFDLVETILRERYAAQVVVRCQKPDFSRPAPDSMLRELRDCEAVITGVGD
jgi:23S rRNA G2069 N7-methylase RlmK/C1962 C5-methylase RlmI